MFHDSEMGSLLDPHDQKLISSVASFRERIVREVMVPVSMSSYLPIDTTIQEAAQLFLKEGYSRIPVYKESVRPYCRRASLQRCLSSSRRDPF